MDKEGMKKWLEALRSEEFEQSRGALFDGIGYCCLGVADKVVFGDEFISFNSVLYKDSEGSIDTLSAERAESLGLNTPVSDEELKLLGKDFSGGWELRRSDILVLLNDKEGADFNKIADEIERLGWDE